MGFSHRSRACSDVVTVMRLFVSGDARVEAAAHEKKTTSLERLIL